MTITEIEQISLSKLIDLGEFECECGKKHSCDTKRVIIENGAIGRLPELLAECGSKKPFILSGHDTFAAAGDKVLAALDKAGISYGIYVFPQSPVIPAEPAVGAAIMHFDYSCDTIIGVGSGVINDIGKMLSQATGRRYIIVGTAPSMDGYASATASPELDNFKVSIDSGYAWAIVGDVDVLKNAPMHLIHSGVGDILAKLISLTEWRIAHIILDEYYCPVIDALVENAKEKVINAIPKLLMRDDDAVKSVMDGLVIAGMAMKYAGVSRPASGGEHYFSHIIDMRALAFSEYKSDLHGIQCGISTLINLKVYDYIRMLRPDRKKALEYAAQFDVEQWNSQLRAFIGPAAEAMISRDRIEKKYDRDKHAIRLDRILDKWSDIVAVINLLPEYDTVFNLLSDMGAPTDICYLGYSNEEARTIYTMTKDMRDKYVGSRLLWDLGELDSAVKVI